MSNAVVFDWDGTLVSCEEKINLTIERLIQIYPEIAKKYTSAISEGKQSPGWIRKGFIVSLPEDYFTYHFGILAELIAEVLGLSIDSAWLVLLRTFKASYLDRRAKMLGNPEKLRGLSQYASLFVVSNSSTDNIVAEAESLGVERSVFSFLGGAKKYGVEEKEPSLLGISAVRPKYQSILDIVRARHQNLVVVGDNFCLDLVTPLMMGVRAAYVSNPLSSPKICEFVKSNQILSGDINVIIDSLLKEMQGGTK